MIIIIDNININKNIIYPNKKELNDNSIGCCNPNMEYMYKMRKDYDQKSNILPNETYNMYNNQKNIPYYKNENEIDKDDKLKRKRNNIYQCKKKYIHLYIYLFKYLIIDRYYI